MKLLSKNWRLIIIAGVILAIPALIVGCWLISPLFRDDEVDEELPESIIFVTSTPGDEIADIAAPGEAGSRDAGVENDMPQEMQAMSEAELTALEVKRGQFRDGDGFHKGSGDAILYRLSDGRHLLRFENFDVTNGPDLHVYLVPRANRDSVSIDEYVDLGRLKGNIGNQNYFVDPGVVIGDAVSVVIWCEPFRVLFSVATLD
jgi:hypothetical protein